MSGHPYNGHINLMLQGHERSDACKRDLSIMTIVEGQTSIWQASTNNHPI